MPDGAAGRLGFSTATGRRPVAGSGLPAEREPERARYLEEAGRIVDALLWFRYVKTEGL
jgi:hypothetical protein